MNSLLLSTAVMLLASVHLWGEVSAEPTFERPVPEEIEVVFEGAHLALFTSGRTIKRGRNRKSGVWNVPSRKVREMWVRVGDNQELVYLDVHAFRSQLINMLPQYPEVHNFIDSEFFTYGELADGIAELNRHIIKVHAVRAERQRIGNKVLPEILK